MVAFLAVFIPLIKLTCTACGIAGGCYCVKKVHDVFKKHYKTKNEKYALKGKSLDELREVNQRMREEQKKAKEALEEQERKNKELGKDLEQAKSKANDSTLSEEERAQWRRKVVVLEEQLASGRGETKNLVDILKKLDEQIKNNNKSITDTLSNLYDKHWIWDFLTLENIMIMMACYAMYKILKEEEDRK